MRTLGQLQLECGKNSLPTAGSCAELMNRLRDYFVLRDNIDMLPQVDVMCAEKTSEYLDYNLEKPWCSATMNQLWNSPDWVVEPKLDGVRAKAHFHPDYKVSPRLDSRRRSDVNYIYAEKTENFPHLFTPIFNDLLEDTILDGEIVPPEDVKSIYVGEQRIDGLNIATSIWNSGSDTARYYQEHAIKNSIDDQSIPGCRLYYWAFDILKLQGQWVIDKPYAYRRRMLESVMEVLSESNDYYHIVPYHPIVNGDRIKIFENEVLAGGEGIMFKHVGASYELGKRRRSWLKLKRFLTIDAVITGFVTSTIGKAWEKYIGAFEVSVYAGEKLVHVASVSAMPMEDRIRATVYDQQDRPVLSTNLLGKVVEIRCQQMTTKSKRGRHAVLVRFRPDKNPEDCTISQISESGSEMLDV